MRVLDRVVTVPGYECWLWALRTQSVPIIRYRDQPVNVRRFMYQWTSGHRLKKGEQVTSSCGISICVNPAHLHIK